VRPRYTGLFPESGNVDEQKRDKQEKMPVVPISCLKLHHLHLWYFWEKNEGRKKVRKTIQKLLAAIILLAAAAALSFAADTGAILNDIEKTNDPAEQERDLEKETYTMNRESRPKLDVGYSYFNDTDENAVHRMGISQHYWSGRWRSSVHFRHTSAKDPSGKNRASEVWARSYGKANDWFSAGGGLGLTQFTNGKKREIITGHIRGDLRFLDGNIGASLSVETLSDTARLIDNRIYFTDAGISLSQELTPRFGFSLRYHYRDYSDENNSSLLQFNAKYLICRGKPEIAAGVRPRYVNFNRQSGGGYFDPEDFLSLQAYVSLFAETGKYFLYLEPFIGVQSFTRFGEETDNTFGGGYGSLGWNISPDFSLELSGEGGNYTLATPAGSEYYRVGVNVNVYF
jgi:hypothetical protein